MLLEKKRFVSLLEIVRREGELLLKTDVRLFTSTIDANWVRQLEYDDDLSERLDAFVSRFGRMQDTLGISYGVISQTTSIRARNPDQLSFLSFLMMTHRNSRFRSHMEPVNAQPSSTEASLRFFAIKTWRPMKKPI